MELPCNQTQQNERWQFHRMSNLFAHAEKEFQWRVVKWKSEKQKAKSEKLRLKPETSGILAK